MLYDGLSKSGSERLDQFPVPLLIISLGINSTVRSVRQIPLADYRYW